MWCRRRAQGVEDVRLPVEWLRQCCIVDTPGTNAVIARHAQLTEGIVPRADIIVFVTSADRPFSESERLFLSTIKSFHKKVVIVVNKTEVVTETKAASNLKMRSFVHSVARQGLTRGSIPLK